MKPTDYYSDPKDYRKVIEELVGLITVASLIALLAAQSTRSREWKVREDSTATYYESGSTAVAVPKGRRQ